MQTSILVNAFVAAVNTVLVTPTRTLAKAIYARRIGTHHATVLWLVISLLALVFQVELKAIAPWVATTAYVIAVAQFGSAAMMLVAYTYANCPSQSVFHAIVTNVTLNRK